MAEAGANEGSGGCRKPLPTAMAAPVHLALSLSSGMESRAPKATPAALPTSGVSTPTLRVLGTQIQRRLVTCPRILSQEWAGLAPHPTLPNCWARLLQATCGSLQDEDHCGSPCCLPGPRSPCPPPPPLPPMATSSLLPVAFATLLLILLSLPSSLTRLWERGAQRGMQWSRYECGQLAWGCGRGKAVPGSGAS